MDIKNHAGLQEANVVLGQHPDDASIRQYFLICLGALMVGSIMLPSPWDIIFVGIVLVIEEIVVVHNHKLGLKVRIHG
jgi:hypothetical protein